MADFFEELDAGHIAFIEEQHLYFVATATDQGRINLSPKGLDSLRVTSPREILWLNLTGSGNESAAHVLEQSRMTLMFCSFDRQPLILRVYGQARVSHRDDERWSALSRHFPAHPGARQIFVVTIESVQTSCGFAVPRFSLLEERDTLTRWSEQRGEDGIRRYWQERNATSIDGLSTGMPSDSHPD